MLNDITFGQYYPAESPLHRLDPRVKLVLTVGLIVVIFLARVAVSLLLVTALLLAVTLLSRIPLRLTLKSLKPVLPLLILTAVINLFYASGGRVVLQVWKLTITTGGLLTAGYMALRICLLILGSSLLTYTTTPTDLTDALERLLSPLKAVRLDVHSLAMMMTIALRFIPTLIEETEKITAAQKARGADLESGSLLRRVRALIPILIPLLISAFRRAAELADAMECRCYHGGEGRTRLKQLRLAPRDGAALVLFCLLAAGVVLANRFLPGLLYGLFARLW